MSELNKESSLLLCDTDLLVIIIWSEVRFGHCHPWILDTFKQQITNPSRHYLLCDYDVPWEADPLRESADSRDTLFELYKQKLEHYKLDYSVMRGDVQNRVASAQTILTRLMSKH